MNGKQYVGRRISRFEAYGQTRPIDGVALVVDEENEYLAGDQSGYVLEITCPYGSQAMADNLLATLQGKSQPGYTAQNAVMDPAAELGDGVTVNGIYAPLVSRRVVFGSGHLGEISAPGESDLDHEYGAGNPVMREINRKLASTRSYIEKTSEEIRLGIEDAMDERLAEMTVTLEGISTRIGDAEGNISSMTQTATGLESKIESVSGDVSSLKQTATTLESKISGVDGSVTSLEQTVKSIKLEVANGEGSSTITLTGDGITAQSQTIQFTGDIVFASDLTDGKTVISGDNIQTGHFSADLIEGGTLVLGGMDNGNGLLEIRKYNGTTFGTLDNTGMSFSSSGRVSGTTYTYESQLNDQGITFKINGTATMNIAPLYGSSGDVYTGFGVYKPLLFMPGSGGSVAFRYGGLEGAGAYKAPFFFGQSVYMAGGMRADTISAGGNGFGTDLRWETVTLKDGRTCRALCAWTYRDE